MNWIASTMGGGGLTRYFSTNRPFWGLLYRLTTPILGSAPLPWHLFAFGLRWLSGILFWWLLRLVWPRQEEFAAWAALLFVVYPGFSQQGSGFLYSHFFIVLNLFLLSFCFTVLALCRPRYFWLFSILAWLSSAVNLLSMEYFFVIDLLRPGLILMVSEGKTQTGQVVPARKRLLRGLVIWLPYLAIWLGSAAWRSMVVGFHTYQPALIGRLQTQPIDALGELVGIALRDVWISTAGAWERAFTSMQLVDSSQRGLLVYWVLVVMSAAASLLYLWAHKNPSPSSPYDRRVWLWQPLVLGGAGLIIAGVPFWLTDLRPALVFSSDRFTLPFMFGASLVVPAFLMWVPLPRLVRIISLAVALGFAVGLQFQHGIIYRRDWNTVNTFFWQMAWRIPDLKPGSVLLSNELPLVHYTDNSLSAAVNWIYNPTGSHQDPFSDGKERMDYILFYPTLRSMSEEWIVRVQKGLPVERDYLAAKFQGSSSQVVLLYFAPPGCLRVLQPEIEAENWMLPENLRALLKLSTLDTILASPLPEQDQPRLPGFIFNPEPAPNWCYYFEKADLARQFQDWDEVVRLSELAFTSGDYPNDPVERLPFIEGYAHKADWQQALQLSRETGAISPVMKPVLCRLWQRIEQETGESPEQRETLAAIKSENNCAQK